MEFVYEIIKNWRLKKVGEIIKVLNEEDVLLICADHGNDPVIGHNKHTR